MKTPLCSDCVNKHPRQYETVWDVRMRQNKAPGAFLNPKVEGLDRVVPIPSLERRWCKREYVDPNFPTKLGQMCNYDEKIMPKHCNGFAEIPPFLVFRDVPFPRSCTFVGAYTTPELVAKAEYSIPHAHVITNLTYFKQQISRKKLMSIVNNLFIKLPVDDVDITHELVWEMLKTQIADNDGFKTLAIHDWVRNMFPSIGHEATHRELSRWGCYKHSSVITIIKDLRSRKWSRGPLMDIRPVNGRTNYVAQSRRKLSVKRTPEEEDEIWGHVVYKRIT